MERINFDTQLWNQWLLAKQLNPSTIKKYNALWERFDFERIGQSYILEFIQNNRSNVARSFVRNLIHYIRSNDFPKEIKGLVSEFELPKITGRQKKRLPVVLSQEQATMLSNAMGTERDAIMVLLSFYCGLRISELLGIKPYDFGWDAWLKQPELNGRLKVIGKGNKQRGVFVPQSLMARVYQYIIKEVAPRGKSKDNPIFDIEQTRWKDILHSASLKSLGRHINPHLLRHSCGTWLKDMGWDLKDIAEYLGHESIATTQIYAHTSQEKLKDKFANSLKEQGIV